MSRKGTCLDNAPAESFFSHFKEEFLRHGEFTSAGQFESELTQYLRWYNHHRIKEPLGWRSPVQYRTELERLSIGSPIGRAAHDDLLRVDASLAGHG